MNKEERKWRRQDFLFFNQLGAGQFGVVYKAKQKETDFVVAIKIIPKKKITSSTIYKRLQR